MDSPRRTQATIMLLAANLAWGLSFPLGKALLLALEHAVPGRSSWFYAGTIIVGRFGLGAVILALAQPRAWGQMRASEWRQGVGLGLCAAAGMILQTDGLAFTAASTSAFLTQFTCVLVPLVVLLRDRRLPTRWTRLAIVLVISGVAVLARFDWHTLRFGRGEIETLIAAGFFTAQILWLERPIFSGNSTGRVSLIMFATIALVLTPLILWHTQSVTDLAALAATVPIALIYLVLTLVCSIFAFLMMNRWQPHVDATTAGILYCAEPLFATLFALFLPAWLATWASVGYENERVTSHLLLGGALITLANVLIAVMPRGEGSVNGDR